MLLQRIERHLMRKTVLQELEKKFSDNLILQCHVTFLNDRRMFAAIVSASCVTDKIMLLLKICHAMLF